MKFFSQFHCVRNDPYRLSVVTFILFSAWMISLPYEGQVLYAMAALRGVDLGRWMQVAIGFLIIGLLSGIFVNSLKLVKKVLLISGIVCLIGSSFFLFASPPMWGANLVIISFFEGVWTASWGWLYQSCTPVGLRIKTASYCLALSALLMIGVNLTATRISPYLGLFFAMLLLLGSLIVNQRLSMKISEKSDNAQVARNLPDSRGFLKLLCLFIIVITINSGLMFSVVTPAFAHLSGFTDWYWAIPYIAAIVVVSRLPNKIDRSYILYAAISMLGLSFLTFMTLGRSGGAYFVVNTLLLGACGINDLFWWTILGEMLEFYQNPAKIMGIGLAANVSGVLLGEVLAGFCDHSNISNLSPVIGIAVICVSIMILPLLQKKLAKPMEYDQRIPLPELSPRETVLTETTTVKHDYSYHALREEVSAVTMRQMDTCGLTGREYQITLLLLKGYTRQLIAQDLVISETTVKTHIRNIYTKLEVNNKTELIMKYGK